MDLGVAEAWIEQWEGYRNQSYDDETGEPITPESVVQGHPTVGVGFNLDAAGAADAIYALGLDYFEVRCGLQILSDDQVDALFGQSVNQAIESARPLIPNFDDLPDDKQIVVVDMIFNLGAGGFGEFVHTIQAINDQDWATAAQQMQDSEWYQQVGARAVADVNLMAGVITATDVL